MNKYIIIKLFCLSLLFCCSQINKTNIEKNINESFGKLISNPKDSISFEKIFEQINRCQPYDYNGSFDSKTNFVLDSILIANKFRFEKKSYVLENKYQVYIKDTANYCLIYILSLGNNCHLSGFYDKKGQNYWFFRTSELLKYNLEKGAIQEIIISNNSLNEFVLFDTSINHYKFNNDNIIHRFYLSDHSIIFKKRNSKYGGTTRVMSVSSFNKFLTSTKKNLKKSENLAISSSSNWISFLEIITKYKSW